MSIQKQSGGTLTVDRCYQFFETSDLEMICRRCVDHTPFPKQLNDNLQELFLRSWGFATLCAGSDALPAP